MSVTLTSRHKNDLDRKKNIFKKIMLIYVNLLCIKYYSLKVTEWHGKPRVRNSPINSLYQIFSVYINVHSDQIVPLGYFGQYQNPKACSPWERQPPWCPPPSTRTRRAHSRPKRRCCAPRPSTSRPCTSSWARRSRAGRGWCPPCCTRPPPGSGSSSRRASSAAGPPRWPRAAAPPGRSPGCAWRPLQ